MRVQLETGSAVGEQRCKPTGMLSLHHEGTRETWCMKARVTAGQASVPGLACNKA